MSIPDAAKAEASTTSINGTVTNTQGQPLSGIRVRVLQPGVDPRGTGAQETAFTDSFGRYTVGLGNFGGGTGTHQYIVYFADTTDQHPDPLYAAQWYPDRSSSDTAQVLSVPPGTELSNIDATLRVGGVITGTVTNATGVPVSGISVFAWSPWRNSYNLYWDFHATTDSNGVYTIRGLANGDYTVFFLPACGRYAEVAGFPSSYCGPVNTLYENQYYNGKTEQEADAAGGPDMVPVTEGEERQPASSGSAQSRAARFPQLTLPVSSAQFLLATSCARLAQPSVLCINVVGGIDAVLTARNQ